MKKVLYYLNPIAHLGDGHYSFLFPFLSNSIVCVLSEVYAYDIAKNPLSVGIYIIFLNIAFLIYFSFREGIPGGFISSAISIAYYFYIIYTRHYVHGQLTSGIETILILAALYCFLAYIIGWLKEKIDQLIEREADGRQRLEAIIQQLPLGVIITDSSGRLQHQNRQIEKLFGKKISGNYLFGKHTSLLTRTLNGEEMTPAKSPLAQVLKTNKSVIDSQYILEKRNRKQIYVQVNASAIRNKQGKIIAAAEVISNITEQKELERQKDDFLSMASHELKTPITSLKMFVDLQTKQLEKRDPTRAIYYNERIRDQANRLKELTNDLLDVSRIQTGKFSFTMEAFDMLDLINETVEELQESSERHKIIMKPSKKCIVYADKYRMYQVLVNLITNAIKYSPQGSDIIVQARTVKGEIIISVRDYGIGIDKDQQEKVFERLYQVTDPAEKTFPGLGLGLYISKQIIERHEGRIWVESTKGKGATFLFSLPLYMEKE